MSVISDGAVNLGPEDFSTSPTAVAEPDETKPASQTVQSGKRGIGLSKEVNHIAAMKLPAVEVQLQPGRPISFLFQAFSVRANPNKPPKLPIFDTASDPVLRN